MKERQAPLPQVARCGRGEGGSLSSEQRVDLVPAPPLMHSETLGKSCNSSEFPFIQKMTGDDNYASELSG